MPLRLCVQALAELCQHRARAGGMSPALELAFIMWRTRAELALAESRARGIHMIRA